MYALLGHNGAGKTTAVEILEGYRERSSGDVTVLGQDPGTAGREFRDRIGIVLQTSGVEHELTVAEVVDIYGCVLLEAARRPGGRRARRSRREARRADPHALRRPAPTSRPGDGHRRSPGPVVPRRADDRLRPGGAPQRVGAGARAGERRDDRAADDPLPRRGRAPGRPGRRAGVRPARRRRHPGRAHRRRRRGDDGAVRAAGRCRRGGRARRRSRRERPCATAGSSSPPTRRRRTSTRSPAGLSSGASSSPASSVARPTLEDVFLELAGSEEPAEVAP